MIRRLQRFENEIVREASEYGYRADQVGVPWIARSASVIVPMLWECFRPASVLDLGCGAGDWLRAFLECGVEEVRGYEHAWLPEAGVRIPRELIFDVDFEREPPPPIRVELVLCLEVVEHLSDGAGRRLAAYACESADVLLWSAAIPGQGGHRHVNERYPSYWADLFAAKGYQPHDLIRPRVWNDERVSWWYRQNLLVFMNDRAASRFGLSAKPVILDVVHPVLYEAKCDPRNYSLRDVLRHLGYYLTRRFRQR